jgi:hypothetical protein
VSLGGTQPRNRASILWLLKKVEERIAFQQSREFAEREQVLAYYQASREALRKLLSAVLVSHKENHQLLISLMQVLRGKIWH